MLIFMSSHYYSHRGCGTWHHLMHLIILAHTLRDFRYCYQINHVCWFVNSTGVNALQLSGGGGGPPLSFFPLNLSSPVPSPSHPPSLLNSARRSGERCKLPHRVRAQPGHQTHFCAFRGKMKHFRGQISCTFNRQNLKVT